MFPGIRNKGVSEIFTARSAERTRTGALGGLCTGSGLRVQTRPRPAGSGGPGGAKKGERAARGGGPTLATREGLRSDSTSEAIARWWFRHRYMNPANDGRVSSWGRVNLGVGGGRTAPRFGEAGDDLAARSDTLVLRGALGLDLGEGGEDDLSKGERCQRIPLGDS